MSKALYLNKTDARDIRNIDQLLSVETAQRTQLLQDTHFGAELWMFFRSLRVRLDKAGDTTKPFQKVNSKDGRRTRHLKKKAA